MTLFYVYAHISYEPGTFVGVYTSFELAKQGISDYDCGFDWITIWEIEADKTYLRLEQPKEVFVK